MLEACIVRVTYSISQGISKILIRFSGCTGSLVGQSGQGKAGDCIFSMEGNENRHLGTGIIVHYRIMSEVKRVAFLVIGCHIYSSKSSIL